VLPLIEQALASIPPEVTQASVRLNPADLATVRLFLNTESPAIQWQCIEDHNVAAGGCVIDTPSAHIDMTVASRWKALLATLGAESHGRA
jgi:flagellar assembly protein FliH